MVLNILKLLVFTNKILPFLCFHIGECLKYLFILTKYSIWSLSGRVVFQVPDWLHHLLMGTRILFKNTLEMYTDYYLHCKLEQLFQEHRLVSLITLLRGIFSCVCFRSCVLLCLVFHWFIGISAMKKYFVYNRWKYFFLFHFRCRILWKHWTSFSPR